jgi:hypothetical protein
VKRRSTLTFTEIINTLIGKSIVIELPGELGLDETLGGQGLHGLDHFQVGHINFRMLGKVEVLSGDQSTIYIKQTISMRPMQAFKCSFPPYP